MANRLSLRITILVLVLSGCFCALAGRPIRGADEAGTQFDPALFSALKWRLVGPYRGGRAIAAAGVPGDPETFYFGSVAGGLWKTVNGGRTWQPVFDQEPVASIGAIAIAPSNPNVIYVGTGESDIRSDLSFGDGVYRSTDAGRTWEHVGLGDSRAISSILVSPRDPSVVLVAALGHPYAPSEERGVYRSTDGGHTWQKVLYKDANTGADLAADPEAGQNVYASLWQARRPPWSVYGPIEGTESGLYKSSDGGVTWTQLEGHGLPASDEMRRIGVSVTWGDAGRRVYALIDTVKSPDRGLYRSDDSGATWQHVSSDARIDGRAWYFSGVFADPQNINTVYVANTALYRSANAGRTFSPIKGAPGGDDYHFLWLDPTNSRRMIVASDQGTVISADGGDTWSSWYNQPTAQIYHVAVDNAFPYHLYGAQQDSGSVEISSSTDARVLSFRDWNTTAGGESGYIAPDPLHPGVVIGGDTYGGIGRFWTDAHQEQNISPVTSRTFNFNSGASGGGCYPGQGPRFTWTSPVVFSPKDPQALYFSSQILWKSTDQGAHWQTISPDLTRPHQGPEPPPGGGPADFQKVTGCGVIYTIAPSPVQADEIWTGTDDGLIHLTLDGGKTWKNVTPPSLTPWSKVSLIEASHFNAATAYAAIDRHRLDDYRPQVLRTRDYGRTWQEVDAGLPDTAYVHVVREDPKRPGLLYAGAETGVFVSFDDGGHWQSLQLNLPTVPVYDLAVHGDDLVAATHGRSFWILDDITALGQLSPRVVESPVYLFQPAAALRLRPRGFGGTPLPTDEPTAENPPRGAIIDYELKSSPAGEVTLEILDAQGKLVRRYSSATPPAPSPRLPVIASVWIHPPQPLGKQAGMNRFVWDLRYAAPAGVGGGRGFFSPRGPMALPGRYQVKLTAGGQSSTQSLEVRLDPRVKTPLADLEHQFAFEQQMLADITRSHALGEQVRGLFRQLSGLVRTRANRARTDEVWQQAAALEAKLVALRGLAPPAAAIPVANTPSLTAIGSTLIQALFAADSADAAPTGQCLEAGRQAEQDLAADSTEWESIKEQDLKTLNETLRRHHLQTITPPGAS